MNIKVIIGIGAALLIFSILYLYRPYDIKIKTLTTQLSEEQQKTIYYQKQYEEQLNINQHLITQEHTVIKQPDGTVIDYVKNTENNTKVSKEIADKENSSETENSQKEKSTTEIETAKMGKSRYSLAITTPVWKDVPTNYGIELGARIGDLPFWLQVGSTKEFVITLGIRGEL